MRSSDDLTGLLACSQVMDKLTFITETSKSLGEDVLDMTEARIEKASAYD